MLFRAVLLLAMLAPMPLFSAPPSSLVFENTFGSGFLTQPTASAPDSQGNVYGAGFQQVSAQPPTQVAFVGKWDANGNQLYFVTFGGSGSTEATGIAVDGSGNAYVTGFTTSSNFPVSAAASQKTLQAAVNTFITKFSPDGSQMLYSTLLGGTALAEASGIAVDSSGDAVVVGQTPGYADLPEQTPAGNFPVTSNAFQSAPVSGCSRSFPYIDVNTSGSGFVTKIAPDGGSLLYSTLLGGSCATGAQAVALDSAGNIWVTGHTQSLDFPVTSDAIQSQLNSGDSYAGFLAQFTPAGALAYASYIGGSSYEAITGIGVDSANNIYLAGIGTGPSQPIATAFQPNVGTGCVVFGLGLPTLTAAGPVFVAKLAPGATAVSAQSYYGGGCVSSVALAVDSSGAPWIAGSLLDGPNTPLPTASPIEIGIGEGFVAKLSADFTQLLYGTYFDSTGGLALNGSGLAYVAGVGPPNSSGAQSAFLAEIDPTPPAVSLDQVLSTGVVPLSPPTSLSIAPGEVLRLIGKNLGPAAMTQGIVNNSGFVDTSVAGVQVTIGGTPAPLLSVSAGEIDCVAPFELTGKGTTTIQVTYNGTPSNSVLIGQAAQSIEVLGIYNDPDFSANSASSPAPPGSTITLYIAGVGQTNPAMQDGQVVEPPYASPGVPIQVEYPNGPGGVLANAQITYAGAAPGLIAGILQVNFVAPLQAPSTTLFLQVENSSINFPVYGLLVNPAEP